MQNPSILSKRFSLSRELITTVNDDGNGQRKTLQALKLEYPDAEITTPVYYASVKFDKLNEFDLIARYILSLLYSRGNPKGKTDFLYQQLVGMPTVAVASSNGVLYIACDKIEITREGIKSVLESTGYIDFSIIKNDKTNNKLHAEMKLLSKINHGIDGKFMGVSKPCCAQCADFLENQGIDYLYWNSQNVGILTPPF
jgi:OTT_1508-like deaminase